MPRNRYGLDAVDVADVTQGLEVAAASCAAAGRHTMSATFTGLGIRPSLKNASATRCWSATVALLNSPTGDEGRRWMNRLTTPASRPQIGRASCRERG